MFSPLQCCSLTTFSIESISGILQELSVLLVLLLGLLANNIKCPPGHEYPKPDISVTRERKLLSPAIFFFFSPLPFLRKRSLSGRVEGKPFFMGKLNELIPGTCNQENRAWEFSLKLRERLRTAPVFPQPLL